MNDVLKKIFIKSRVYNYIILLITTILLFIFIIYDQFFLLKELEIFAIIFFIAILFLVFISFNTQRCKNLILFLSFPFISFFILEFFFGSWNNEVKTSVKKIKNTTIVQKNIWYNSKDQTDDKISLFINNFGLRGKTQNNSLDHLDILFVGGSTTIQSTITDGKTFIDVLEKNFEKINNKKLYFLNGGEDAHDTKSHIQSLNNRFKELKIKPKYIMFFIGHNEGINSHTYDRFHVTKNELLIKLYNSSFILNKFLEARIYIGTLILNPSKFHRWHLNGYVPLENDLIEKNFISIKKDIEFEKNLINEIELELNFTRKNILELGEIVINDYGAIPIFMNLVKATYSKSNKNNEIKVFKKPIIDKSIVNLRHDHDIRINYYYPKVLADNIINACANIKKAICIDAFNNSGILHSDFHDFSHFKPSGATKLGNLIYMRIKNEFL